MLRAHEVSQMLFFHNEFLLCIFKWKWNRENEHLLIKISNKKHLLQCNIEYNDETIKI